MKIQAETLSKVPLYPAAALAAIVTLVACTDQADHDTPVVRGQVSESPIRERQRVAGRKRISPPPRVPSDAEDTKPGAKPRTDVRGTILY